MLSHRSLTSHFLAHLDRTCRFPRTDDIVRWVRTHRGGVSAGTVNDLRKGRLVPERHITNLLLFLESPSGLGNDPERRATLASVREYLEERGMREPYALASESVRAVICTPSVYRGPQPEEDEGRADFPQFIADVLLGVRLSYMLEHNVRGIYHSEGITRTSAEYMFERCGQLADTTRVGLSRSEYRKKAETECIYTSVEDYTHALAAWLAFNPWTAVESRHRGKRVGMTVVLPLTDSAYERIANGQLQSCHLAADDLQFPSSNLLIESAAEYPPALHTPSVNPSIGITRSLALQLGALMRYDPRGETKVARWMSFCAFPENASRLLHTGFSHTGTNMFGTGHPIVERTIDFESGSDLTILEGYFLSVAGRNCPASPPIQ